jgi:sulfatase maturation enzyme AslB (radical SAM superfamily)
LEKIVMTIEKSQPLMGSVKYREGLDFGKILNESLYVFFKDAWRVTLSNPSQAYHFLKTIRWQKKAARIRSNWERQGIEVPPILIFSITNRCNLRCKGCYNWALRPSIESEMDPTKLRNILTEARELGISFVMIAGGMSNYNMKVTKVEL